MNPTYLTAYTVPYFYEYSGEYVLVIGTENGKIHLYNNIENNIFGYYNSISNNIINDNNAIRSCPTIGDINNDGIPDLIRGNASGGVELFLGNEFNLEQSDSSMLDNEIIIYPNPNNGSFTIINNYKSSLNIKILTITGKLLYNSKIYQGSNTIEMLDLKPGVYLIKSEDSYKTTKIIIN